MRQSSRGEMDARWRCSDFAAARPRMPKGTTVSTMRLPRSRGGRAHGALRTTGPPTTPTCKEPRTAACSHEVFQGWICCQSRPRGRWPSQRSSKATPPQRGQGSGNGVRVGHRADAGVSAGVGAWLPGVIDAAASCGRCAGPAEGMGLSLGGAGKLGGAGDDNGAACGVVHGLAFANSSRHFASRWP